jgi:undecaprenyl-diphosphatase
VVEHRAGWLDPVFIGLSVVGYFGAVWIALALAISLATRRNPAFPALLTAASVWTADLLALAFKAVFERPRPSATIPQADPLMGAAGHAFPSGHAATAFAGAVVLSCLWRRGAAFFFLLAAAIAYSRVYVGVHYPGDIRAGALLGAAVGAAWVLALTSLQLSGADRPRSRAGPPGG